MNKDTQEFVNDITQGLIDSNNKWFEERKQAKKDFEETYNNLYWDLCVDIEDDGLKSQIRDCLKELKNCMYRM